MSGITGKNIVITRPLQDMKRFVELLLGRGAAPVKFPTIRTERPEDDTPVKNACREIESYDWIVFSSSNGFRSFMEHLRSVGRSAENLKSVRICAVGSSTRRYIEKHRLRVDLMPAKHTGMAAARSLIASHDIAGKRVLVPTSQIGKKDLPEKLTEAGATVDVVIAYRTMIETRHSSRSRNALMNGPVDAITFTSRSCAENLVNILGKADFTILAMRAPFFSIGSSTTKYLKAIGTPPAAEADPHTVEGLVEALEKYFEKEQENGANPKSP
jgi:uroporphyrinogen III methyltransferase/synthase